MIADKEFIENLIAKVKVHYAFNFKNFTSTDFEILVESWFEDLQAYPKELIEVGFREAKKFNKISVTTADIVEQIEKFKSAATDTKEELWNQLISLFPKIRDYNNHLTKTILVKEEVLRYNPNTDEHKTVVEDVYKRINYGYIKLPELFNSLSPVLQSYAVNVRGLVDLAELDNDSLQYEKGRFMKDFNSFKERIEIHQKYPQLSGLVENIGLLK